MKRGMNVLFCLIFISLIGIVSAEICLTSDCSGEANVDFSLATAQPSCQFNVAGDVSYWVWWDQSQDKVIKDEIGFPINNPKFSCYRLGGWPSDGCCPYGIQCNPDSATDFPGQCNGFAPAVCSDYNEDNYGTIEAAESYCKAFNINTAIESIESFTGIPGICSGDYSVPINVDQKINCNQYTSNCRCYWDDSAGECKSKSTSYVFCDDGKYSEGNCTQGNIIKNDECNGRGLITYSWEAIWADSQNTPAPGFCAPGTKTFSCNIIKLNFFTFINVFFVILIVVVIYYFINQKK